MIALDAFASADFDWTRQLRSVWRDPPYHVQSLHRDNVDELVRYFLSRTRDPDPLDEPLGKVIVGPAGHGKTHLIGELRRRVWKQEGWFVLLDFIGIKDFWSSVALGFLNSLQVNTTEGQTQYDLLVSRLASSLKLDGEMIAISQDSAGGPYEILGRLVDLFFVALSRAHRQEAVKHRDVVTALILLISEDLDCHSVAHAWLQGMNLDKEIVAPLGLRGENSPVKVVEGLSWLMSLTGPTLIAVDQIDAIVTASNLRVHAAAADAEQQEAQSIVASLSQGLMDLHEKKRRAVTVVSCLEATWAIIRTSQVSSVTARYDDPMPLAPLIDRDTIGNIIEARLSPAYEAENFTPPFPTWPFSEKAVVSASGLSPRRLLQACEAHRKLCVSRNQVLVCDSFDVAPRQGTQQPPGHDALHAKFETELKGASVAGILDDEHRFHELLLKTLRLYEKHLELPDDIDVAVQNDPDQKRPSLHGRLSFTFRAEGDREQHYCFRILGHDNANAFQSRLKAAMTASGIDRSLKFRHLFILRSSPEPGGAKTQALVEQFRRAGGRIIAPTESDVRMFVALSDMATSTTEDFDDWLRKCRPLFEAELFRTVGLAPPPFANQESAQSPSVPIETGAEPSSEAVSAVIDPETAVQPEPGPTNTGSPATSPLIPSNARAFPVGRRYSRGKLGDAVLLKADLLPQHVAIIAGPGSGKTVLLRRIIEEAALLGIPSVVLDINNDLSRLGKPWPEAPEAFSAEDAEKANAYDAGSETVIWTPGAANGNPMSLKLLPDFSAIGAGRDPESDDQRAQAVEMALATLSPYIVGSGQAAALRKGVLADALRYFAAQGRNSLDELIDLLSELPEGVSRIRDAADHAARMADQLLAAVSTSPLLRSSGPGLDPQALFYGAQGRTRISVINFSGLASDEARLSFVNQLQMALFTWIKKHPSQTGRLYVLDEAQNFVPSQKSTPCKASGQALVAQARKYGLGMILATQLPKGLDNGIVSSSLTHVYGRMSSPATIEATKEIMSARGGAADDLGRLATGEFYFSTEHTEPTKIKTPLCLSHHPKNPPTSDEVIAWARACARPDPVV